MTSMKHARFIAATVLAALLLAGCTGRRTAGDAADKASAGDGTSETAVSTPKRDMRDKPLEPQVMKSIRVETFGQTYPFEQM